MQHCFLADNAEIHCETKSKPPSFCHRFITDRFSNFFHEQNRQ